MSIEDLAREVLDHNVILFVGCELSAWAGLPNDLTLAQRLADRLGMSVSVPDAMMRSQLPGLAQRLEERDGRNVLIRWLREQVDLSDQHPTQSHQLLVRLPIKAVFVTAYDNLLTEAFRESGQKVNIITSGSNLPYWSEQRVNLVKMRGSLDTPDSLVITRRDHNSFFRTNGSIHDLLSSLLASKTCLFVGYDWSNSDIELV